MTRRSAPETKSGFRFAGAEMVTTSFIESSHRRLRKAAWPFGKVCNKISLQRGDRDRMAPSLAWFCRGLQIICLPQITDVLHTQLGR